MERIPILSRMHIDQLYLDTTWALLFLYLYGSRLVSLTHRYCSSAYNFPSQGEVISFVTQKAREAIDTNPKTLIVCGTYTIGKEKIFLGM